MQNQEPYLGNEEQQTPSWMKRKPRTTMFWTITWAVCTGILLANFIEAMIAAITFYLNIKFVIDPAVKNILK